MTSVSHRRSTTDFEEIARRRRRNAIIASVLICAIGSCISFKLVDRLAVSNLAQVVGLVVLLAGNPRLLRLRDLALLAVTFAGILAAAWLMLGIYGYAIQWQYTIFYALALTWILAVIRVCSTPEGSEAFVEGIRLALPVILLYLSVMFVIDLGTGLDKRRLGFDDKSHASVYTCVLAFLSLRFLRGRWRLFAALAFFTLSLLTISRLPFLFAPAFLLAFFVEYRKVRRSAKTALDVYICHLMLAGAFATPFVLAAYAGDLFASFNRVFTPGSNSDTSTQAHLLLLQYAGELKLENIANFLFGVTPGGYSGTLIRSDVDISQFASTDPPGYEKMLLGIAPMHSSTGTILLEFPIWIGLAYIGLVVWLIVRLLRSREFGIALMVIGFIIATTMYSSVTELYFSLTLAVAIATVGLHPSQGRTHDIDRLVAARG